MSEPASDIHTQGPSSGHLGTAWEIAVVTIFVFVAVAIVATIIFQIRRKRRRAQREREDAELAGQKSLTRGRGDLENQQPDNSSDKSLTRPLPTASPYRKSKSSSHDGSTKPPRYYWESTQR